MTRYRFEEIAINSTEKKKPTLEDKDRYIGLEHLDSGSLTVTRFGADVAPIGEKLLMKKGDVLFGKRRAYQKKVAIAPFDGIFSAHGMVLRPIETVVTREYFPFFISSDYFLNAAITISVGSLSPTINWRELKELEFDLPSLEEQKRLADILWAAEEEIQACNNAINALKLTRDVSFSSWIKTLEENTYNLLSLDTICETITDGSHFSPAETKDGYYIPSVKDMSEDGFNFSECKRISLDDYNTLVSNGCKPKIHDVLLAKDGSILKYAFDIKEEADIVVLSSIAILRPKQEIILSEYLALYFKNSIIVSQILSENQTGSAIKRIILKNFKKLEIVVPTVNKQREIIKRMELFNQCIYALDKKILTTNQFLKVIQKG